MTGLAALPCIVCRKVLSNVFEDAHNQPDKGMVFNSNGHYGSTLFDEMNGSYLELNICDSCMVDLSDAGLVLHATPRPRQPDYEYKYKLWRSDE